MTETMLTVVSEFWTVLSEMAPYLLFGFFVAGVLSVMISPETVERHLGGAGLSPVAKASLFGVPLPLCSCGVIPVAASLRRHGASRGATTAFLLSTPQTGADSILVTYSLLGPVFAVFRPIVAFVTGVLGGSLVMGAERDDDTGPATDEPCSDSCCSDAGERSAFSRALTYGLVTLPRDIGRALLVGLAIAGLISALVPSDYFAGALGTRIVGMLVMMLLGIPVYVCATASVPVAAALMAKGVSPGAAFAFLVTGPATNAAAIATIWKVLGKRTTLTYLVVVAVSAVAFGFLLDYLVATVSPSAPAPAMEMKPNLLKTISAVALLIVLVAAMYHSQRPHADAAEVGAQRHTSELLVEGMTCSHCADSVRRALMECPGVDAADVDLKTGRAVITGGELNMQGLRAAVDSLGFEVKNISRDVECHAVQP